MRLIPLLALAALACTSSTGPNQGLEIRADVAPAAFHVGDAATVTITMTNHSSQPRTIETNTCLEPFVVKDSGGHVVAGPGAACTLQGAPRTLAPGEQYSYSDAWTGQSLNGNNPPTNVAPGTYSVTGPSEYSGAEYVAATIQILP